VQESSVSPWDSDVVLADGGTVRLRPIRADDEAKLLALYERLSTESRYLRFFSPVPPPTATQLEMLTTVDESKHMSLVALLGNDMVAVARYDRVGPGVADVAFTVDDAQHGRGLATVLLEHLAVVARANGIATFTAETLPGNDRMLDVFTAAGWKSNARFEDGVVRVRFDIAPTAESVAVVQEREHIAEAASVARLLSPRSIAVIGASRTPATIGHEIFRNLLNFGFTGPVYPVNPTAGSVAGVRAYATVLDVPDAIDLAIIVVRAELVPAAVAECAQKRVHGLVIISAGFAETGEAGRRVQRELVETARRNGMRMIGPNCLGIVNASPSVRMNATFAPTAPRPGTVAFLSQSGGLGIEVMARATALGIGISDFVSVGNKADVSGNDLLQYWEQAPETDLILLYLESFGNPRKFARLARRIARKKPIVAVKSGRTPAGTRAASSHTAALAAPDVAVDALFRQAGVIRVDTLEELLDIAKVLANQPLPPGPRVAIVSNAGGPGILAADACAGAGLDVVEFGDETRAHLREFVAADASVSNPIDLVAGVSAEVYERALRVVLSDDSVDAVLAIFVPPLVTRVEDAAAAIAAAAAVAGPKPIVACFLGRDGIPRELEGDATRRTVPSFAFPEAAARALGRVSDLAAWRRRDEGTLPVFDDLDIDGARHLVDARLAASSDGEWLAADDAHDLLTRFGIPMIPTRAAADADAAVAAAIQLGFPVALKTGDPAIVHKTDVGGVALGLADADAVRHAFDAMHDRLGDAMGGAVVQPMLAAGTETIIGLTHDPSFGPIVLFGMGGITAELVADTALRIVPMTDADARELVRGLRSSPLFFGYRRRPALATDELESMLLRVSRLADELPEIAELDLNPVMVLEDRVLVVDAKVRIAPAAPPLPPDFRRLRS
jgi:acetyl coenzyme A synthetase (ADP forming)-like protein